MDIATAAKMADVWVGEVAALMDAVLVGLMAVSKEFLQLAGKWVEKMGDVLVDEWASMREGRLAA